MEHEESDQKPQSERVKSREKSKSSRKSGLDFRKYTQQIWLAGLGAFSRAEEEGNKLFDALVKVGEELESKTLDSTHDAQKDRQSSNQFTPNNTSTQSNRLDDQDLELEHKVILNQADLTQIQQLLSEMNQKIERLRLELQQIKDKPSQD